jgi:hypothetical protein
LRGNHKSIRHDQLLMSAILVAVVGQIGYEIAHATFVELRQFAQHIK